MLTLYERIEKRINEKQHPVGSTYMSFDSTDPSSLFGGTWEQIKDTFLLACGDTYSAGETGGEATHTLTTDEMPEHTHSLPNGFSLEGTSITDEVNKDGYGHLLNIDTYNHNSGRAIYDSLRSTGGGQAHNNMPPYMALYVWKRVA